MELALNLVWAIGAAVLLSFVYRAVRRGAIRFSMATAITLTLLICFILLPAISVSDDLLDAQQAALPLCGQTWRMSSEAIRSGLDTLVAVGLYLLLLMCFLVETRVSDLEQWAVRPVAGRLVRSQRLRPPPPAVY